VAFALGRALGPAVVRNRVRRRLREVVRAAWSAGSLPPGDYLIGGSPDIASLSSDELSVLLERILTRLGGQRC
jgi:ribonuclease P protein component